MNTVDFNFKFRFAGYGVYVVTYSTSTRGDQIRCTGWQFVGYNIAAAVVAVLLSIKY